MSTFLTKSCTCVNMIPGHRYGISKLKTFYVKVFISFFLGFFLFFLLISCAEVKTEEGYSADIHPWRYMSAQCPHYVSMKKTFIAREMLCGHSADIVRTYMYLQGYMSALYPSSVFSSGETHFLYFISSFLV